MGARSRGAECSEAPLLQSRGEVQPEGRKQQAWWGLSAVSCLRTLLGATPGSPWLAYTRRAAPIGPSRLPGSSRPCVCTVCLTCATRAAVAGGGRGQAPRASQRLSQRLSHKQCVLLF